MGDHQLREHLVWVTRTLAVNPSNVIAVFHGRHGHIELYLPGDHRQIAESELTDAGRALLVPPPELGAAPCGSIP
jgi:hypothetical protein